ncbi:murein biosynthesis integral membrane protein MurJ [Moraxella sp. FZLJ2107]|uniref:murein biosynthesis integral membrane protein MurJ n=1 Tax=unclassified Moraxella TaxID=2685852 RepID=UPI0020C93112|nr:MULTISPECIES: murein biosynthesis integral membrane protein MurJ [unclassified Moraxella]UTO06042.1 murein biosynthesis integral membrane protein MurJ [Moraxella sp. FZLJ2107]UTO22779.1 murein biosynthesis integral membrane protein MurJ [Moraxella sp. FZLJ2109]
MAKSRLFRSTMIVSASTMLSRILGLVRDMVLMSVFGAGGLMDAFLVAFKIPNFLRRLFAEGAFSQAFVPVLTEYKEKRTFHEVQLLISRASGALTSILLVLTVVVILLAPQVITLFAPGFHGDGEKFATAAELLRLTFPYLLLISMTAFYGSVLNSYGKFAAPAFAPVLLNVCMIVGALIIAPMMDTPIMALGYAVAVSGLLQLLIQLPQLWKQKLLVAPSIDFKDEGVVRILKLMLPAIFGVSVTQINLLLSTVFASLMIAGSVSWMYAAERLSELPLGLIGVAIGTVILPSLSSSRAKADDDSFKKTLDWAARLIILIGLPAALAMFVLSDVLMDALFVRGEFSHQDALMSGIALKALAGGILSFMLIKIFAPAFFAGQDTKTPVKVGIASVFANMIFSVLFIGLFYLFDLPLHGGLALATTAASFVNAGLLYFILHKRGIYRFGTHWKKLFTQFGIASAAMVAALYVILPYYPIDGGQWLKIAILLGICAAGAAVYGVVLLATGFRPRQLKHG